MKIFILGFCYNDIILFCLFSSLLYEKKIFFPCFFVFFLLCMYLVSSHPCIPDVTGLMALVMWHRAYFTFQKSLFQAAGQTGKTKFHLENNNIFWIILIILTDIKTYLEIGLDKVGLSCFYFNVEM